MHAFYKRLFGNAFLEFRLRQVRKRNPAFGPDLPDLGCADSMLNSAFLLERDFRFFCAKHA
jgi:hypothetical protein